MSFYIGPFLIFEDKLVERDLAIRVCPANPSHAVRQMITGDQDLFCGWCGTKIIDSMKKIQVKTSRINGNCPSDLTKDELVLFHSYTGDIYVIPNMAFDDIQHYFEQLGNANTLGYLGERNTPESLAKLEKRFEQSISKMKTVYGEYRVEYGILQNDEY